jgi:voltage-gated potassium channel Kch
MAVLATYQINYSERLQRLLSRLARMAGIRDLGRAESEIQAIGHRPIVMLGFFRIADAFLSEVMRREQHLIDRLKVVDFNPEVRQRLHSLGIPCTYGDISHPDTLHHAEVEKAQVILCTIPDVMLRGTSNAKLLKVLRQLAPRAEIVVTAETPEQASELYAQGADFVLQPNLSAGEYLVTVVEQAERGTFDGMREEATGKYAVLGRATS